MTGNPSCDSEKSGSGAWENTSYNCGILCLVVAIDGPFGRYRILPSVLFSPFLFALTDQPQLSHVRSQRDNMSLHFLMAPQSGPQSLFGSYHPW